LAYTKGRFEVYPENDRKEGIGSDTRNSPAAAIMATALPVKKTGHTDEGLAAAAASLTAAERWWSCSSSSFRLFASICLRRCSSYATASAISLLSGSPLEQLRGAEQTRRRCRENKNGGFRLFVVPIQVRTAEARRAPKLKF